VEANTSEAKAQVTWDWRIAALKRCATQNPNREARIVTYN